MSVNTIQCNTSSGGSEIPFSLDLGEKLAFRTTTARQTFSLQLCNNSNSSTLKVKIAATDGHIYVTNKRLVYITGSQGDFDSFVVDFKHASQIQFSHTLKCPWIGANYWEFMFFSPAEPICDGLPKNDCFKGQIVFKDGGLYRFVEVLNVAINDIVNNSNIDDELPRYSEL